MTPKAPATRRKFWNEWDEIEYLQDKVLYWFYERGNPAKALPFCERLEKLLPEADPNHEAILGEECWSLIYEAKGDLENAIGYRENEIKGMKRLQEIAADSPDRDFILQGCDYGDLSDRLVLLAILYHDAGDLDKAIRTLRDSRRLCERHGIPFEGEDLLNDYLAEKRSVPAAGRASRG